MIIMAIQSSRNIVSKNVKRLIIFFLFLWMISPVIIPDDYSGHVGDERKIVEIAVREVNFDYGGLFMRSSVKNITECDSGWEVRIISCSLFNIPIIESNITIQRSASGFSPKSSSFTEIFPFASWVLLLPFFIACLIIFGFPVLAIYYFMKTRKPPSGTD